MIGDGEMHLLSSFIFAASSNMDNWVIGLSYGLRQIRIPLISCILISLLTSLGTVLAMLTGQYVLSFLPSGFGNILGSCFIILFGIWGLIQSLRKKPVSSDTNEKNMVKRTISLKEAAVIGCALSINNISIGVGASVTGMGLVVTVLLSFSFSFLFLFLGNQIGKVPFLKFVQQSGEIIANLLILFLGFYELFI
jgi:putative Mn2+ efflux pump MntP